MATSTSSSFLLKTFPQNFLQRSHFHCYNHTNSNLFPAPTSKCRFGLNMSKIQSSRLVVAASSSAAAAGVVVVGQGQDGKYLARESRWGVRRMVKVREEMRKVAHVQAEAFHTPVALFDDLFFEFFKAEVISALSYRLLNSPPDRYACLVAEAAADEHSSSWEPQKEIVGVVDVTVQRDDDVLSHIQGEGEYLYVSGIAVLTKFRRQKVATALLKACDMLSVLWGFSYLALRAHEDDFGARKLYANTGYEVVSRDPVWITLIGRRRRVLMVKRSPFSETSHEQVENL
ncbi:GCN5-related N-acetyltransferase 10, chloroplastic [Curcuma longa]|uniref:GCN5-related N-acetyltransferase 10, chloroplastic n=1 Tax=Curcuma longa TaxID=136217 RepID=UPI003D9DC454